MLSLPQRRELCFFLRFAKICKQLNVFRIFAPVLQSSEISLLFLDLLSLVGYRVNDFLPLLCLFLVFLLVISLDSLGVLQCCDVPGFLLCMLLLLSSLVGRWILIHKQLVSQFLHLRILVLFDELVRHALVAMTEGYPLSCLVEVCMLPATADV